MPKPTKHATAICIILSVIALIGMVLGLYYKNALYIMVTLLPAIGYAVYRTEGRSTKGAAMGLFALFIAEFIFIVFNISFNLAEFLGATEKEIGGYLVPLGDVKIVAPVIVAILSLILLIKAWGRYVRWLAAVIILGSFALVYTLDPAAFQDLLKLVINTLFHEIPTQ